MSLNTNDYIQLLYDLEAGLYRNPYVESHDIRRTPDKKLNITVRLKELVDPTNVMGLIQKAQMLGEWAVRIQKFAAAKIEFRSGIDYVLEDIVVIS